MRMPQSHLGERRKQSQVGREGGQNVNLLTELREDELTELSVPESTNYASAAFKDVIERLKDRKK